MPTFDITAPDGQRYQVTPPNDTATEQDALDYVKKNHDTLKAMPAEAASDGSDSRARQDARAVVSQEDPAQHAVLSGATFGWINELGADEQAAIVGAENLYRKATGKPVPYGIGEARRAMLAEERASAEEFEKAHPFLDEALELGGGMAGPGVGKAAQYIGKGETALARAARAALTGAGVGAVAGASDERGRIGGAVTGAEEGAVTAGSLHLIGSAARSGLPIVAKKMGLGITAAWNKIVSMFGADNPKVTAQQLAEAQKKALKYVHDVAQAAGKTPDAIRNNPDAALGKPVLGAEAIGRPGVSQLAAIGRRGGETPDKLESTLRQRAQSAPDRVVSDLSKLTSTTPATIEGDFGAQVKEMRAKADPFYRVAYAQSTDSPELRQFLVRPSVKKALAKARNIAEEEGRNPDTMGIKTVGRLQQVGQHLVDTTEQIEVHNPTIQTWDYIKRGLDGVLENYRNKLTGKLELSDPEARATLDTLNDLRAQLFKESPAYEHAVSLGGEAPRQAEAYHAAPQLMKPTVSETQFDERIAKYTPAQREALKGGFISDVYNRARAGKLRLPDMQSPAFLHKAEKILGPQAAQQFLVRTQAEMRIAGTGGRMMPGVGSHTMELGAAEAEREQGLNDVGKAVLQAARGDRIGAILRLARLPGDIATAPLDVATRNEVGRLLMLPPDKLADALTAYATRVGGSALGPKIVKGLMDSPAALDAARRLTQSIAAQIAQPSNRTMQ